jgi:hypothetical protein
MEFEEDVFMIEAGRKDGFAAIILAAPLTGGANFTGITLAYPLDPTAA